MFISYCQRNKNWADTKLGNSNRTLAQVGCTTSCVCMAASYFGDTINPKEAALSLSYTQDALLIWKSINKIFKKTNFTWRFYSYDQKLIDEALKNPNKTLILNVDNGGHWVFALKRIPFTAKFWVLDPWDGKKKIYGGVVGGATLGRK